MHYIPTNARWTTGSQRSRLESRFEKEVRLRRADGQYRRFLLRFAP